MAERGIPDARFAAKCPASRSRTRGALPLHGSGCYALAAGQEAGGDSRGRQSAALLVVRPKGGYGGWNDRYLDLRVDDSKNTKDSENLGVLGVLVVIFRIYSTSLATRTIVGGCRSMLA